MYKNVVRKSVYLFLIGIIVFSSFTIYPKKSNAQADSGSSPTFNLSDKVTLSKTGFNSYRSASIGEDSNGKLNLVGETSRDKVLHSLRDLRGNATYSTEDQLPTEIYDIYASSLADLDGDGYLDFVTAGPNGANGSPNNVYHWNTSTNQYDKVGSAYELFGNAFYGSGVLTGDFTNDGKEDVLWMNTLKASLAVNNSTPGNINFSSFKDTGLTLYSGMNNNNSATGDFNNDGNLDFVTTYSKSNTGGYYSIGLGKGDGTFSFESYPYSGGTMTPSALSVGDFNSDGKDDFVLLRTDYTNSKSEVLSFTRNNTNDGFDLTTLVEANQIMYDAEVGDLNGDGLPDLVLANGSLLDVYLNKDGSFSSTPDFTKTIGAALNQLFIEDVNNDNRMDVLTVSNAGVNAYLQDFLPTATPSLSGQATVGQTLEASSGYRDGDNDEEAGTTYAFYRYDEDGVSNETLLQGPSTTNTYTVKESDIGSVIRVKVIPKNAIGTGGEVISDMSDVVPSGNSYLSDLSLGNVALSPAFSKDTTTYTAAVDSSVDSIDITPSAESNKATIVTNGSVVNSGNSESMDLNVGENTVTTIVTAGDGSTRTYTIIITREAPDSLPTAVPSLIGQAAVGQILEASSGYADADNDEESGTTYAFYRYDGDGVSNEILLQGPSDSKTYMVQESDIGSVIKVKVVPKNNNGTGIEATSDVTNVVPSTNSYLADLSFGDISLSPAFSKDTTSYTATVDNSVDSINVTPSAESGRATVVVNGSIVESGSSETINLHVGENAVTTIVKAEDGSTYTYTVIVNREASDEPAPEPEDSLPTATPSLIGEASVGQTLSASSGYADADNDEEAGTTYAFYRYDSDGISNEALLQGPSDSKTYTVQESDAGSVIKVKVVPKNAKGTGSEATSDMTSVVPSTTSELTELSLGDIAISPAFSKDITSYTATVDNSVSFINITPAAESNRASVMVNGSLVENGSTARIDLNAGDNTITITVTAEDGSITTYTLVITREAVEEPVVNPGTGEETEVDPGTEDGTEEEPSAEEETEAANPVTVEEPAVEPQADYDENKDTQTVSSDEGSKSESSDVTEKDNSSKKADEASKLPKTATDTFNLILIGVMVLLAGLVLIINNRRKSSQK